MAARCSVFAGAVSALVIVRMTILCATSAHNLLTYLAAKCVADGQGVMTRNNLQYLETHTKMKSVSLS